MKGGSAMSDLKNFIKKQLENPEFLQEYESNRPEYEVMRAIIKARLESNLSQQELAQRSGLRQSNISRIENGTAMPNLSTLIAIANGLGKTLHIEFR